MRERGLNEQYSTAMDIDICLLVENMGKPKTSAGKK